MSAIVTVDDRDSSIQYSGSWGTGGTYPEYDNTTTGSTKSGDTATFSFTGTWVSVYGTTGWASLNGLPTTQFTVDGGTPVSFTAPNITGFPLYHYQMFASDALNDTTHTVIVENTSPGSPCTTWLDFFEYIPSQSDQHPLSSPPATTSASGTTSSSKSHTSTAALAGGIGGGLGAVVLFTALALAFYYRNYRRERSQRLQLADEMAARSYQRIDQQPQMYESFSNVSGLRSTIEHPLHPQI